MVPGTLLMRFHTTDLSYGTIRLSKIVTLQFLKSRVKNRACAEERERWLGKTHETNEQCARFLLQESR